MKRTIGLLLCVLLPTLLLSACGGGGTVSEKLVLGEEVVYLYDSMPLSELSNELGRTLTAPGLAEDAPVPNGTPLYDGETLYRTAIVMGDLNADGLVDAADVKAAETLLKGNAEPTSAQQSAFDFYARGENGGTDALRALCGVVYGGQKMTDYLSYRTEESSQPQLLVQIDPEFENPDRAIYTAAYFGDGFTDCQVLETGGGERLCLLLTPESAAPDNIERQIRQLNERQEVYTAGKYVGGDQSLTIVEGEALLYLYGETTLEELSQRTGKTLTSPNLAAGDPVPNGTALYEGDTLYRTAIVMGDLNADGHVSMEDVQVLTALSEEEAPNASAEVAAALDLCGSGAPLSNRYFAGDIGNLMAVVSGEKRLSDFAGAKTSGFPADQLLVIIDYEAINPDYTVYTASYFGENIKSCTVCDLFANHGLYLLLTVENTAPDRVDETIRALYARDEVFRAERAYADLTYGLTPNTDAQQIKRFHRQYPYSDEFPGFGYDRGYRLLYYTVPDAFESLVSAEEVLEWLQVWREENGIPAAGDATADPQEMALVSFLRYFSIDKETAEETARQMQESFAATDSFNQYTELGEVPDIDLLYTFDNEKINAYYRYDS